ncbi:Fasciclin-like arabinogalactan protein 4 [Nymphaea thermarum]|nr:Fasciclin-like arabinogalactan protein 4 [Nymphaea thermarum]
MPPLPDSGFRRRFGAVIGVVLLLFCRAVGFNVTTFLSSFPDLSTFNHLLATTEVAGDLDRRSSLTILAVPNHLLDSTSLGRLPSAQISDVLRYHVLLQYLDWTALRQIPASGKLVATLYQTTGRAEANLGAVNITHDPLTGNVTVRPPGAFAPSNATVVSLIRAIPYSVAVYAVDGLLLPSGYGLSASESRPQVPFNITAVLIGAKDFNVVAAMLAASGVTAEFENDEQGAGITAFLPTDDAFTDLSAQRLQSLPADTKAVVLKYHVLHSYYPLGSLQSIVNPVQPTLATEEKGAGSFTLNITRANGSVALDTGIVQAAITQTVFDQNPVAIFGISNVLLPREVFGSGQVDQSTPVSGPPDYSSAPTERPAQSPGAAISPTSEAPPIGSLAGVSSSAGGGGEERSVVVAGILGVLGLWWIAAL